MLVLEYHGLVILQFIIQFYMVRIELIFCFVSFEFIYIAYYLVFFMINHLLQMDIFSFFSILFFLNFDCLIKMK